MPTEWYDSRQITPLPGADVDPFEALDMLARDENYSAHWKGECERLEREAEALRAEVKKLQGQRSRLRRSVEVSGG